MYIWFSITFCTLQYYGHYMIHAAKIKMKTSVKAGKNRIITILVPSCINMCLSKDCNF